jgi:hypothetical protein
LPLGRAPRDPGEEPPSDTRRRLAFGAVGQASAGRTPEGDARVDQSRLPAVPPHLETRVKNVNLPDGTVLEVEITSSHSSCAIECPLGAIVGTITLQRGEGRLATALGCGVGVCQVGRTDHIFVRHGDIRILDGGAPWQV